METIAGCTLVRYPARSLRHVPKREIVSAPAVIETKTQPRKLKITFQKRPGIHEMAHPQYRKLYTPSDKIHILGDPFWGDEEISSG